MKLLLKENGLVLYHPGSRKKDSGCKPNLGLRKSFHFSPELKGDLVCIQSIEILEIFSVVIQIFWTHSKAGNGSG